ncbi:MAG: TraR/DksA C4-type zinc finger protein [Actinobacteria bacterium]|nr:TraR/DksA C4-type zinc finger protein [Actinomycetota bacterium]
MSDHLGEDQRDELLREVAARRERTVARITALEHDFDDIVEASSDAVRDDEHDPEGATIAFERAQVSALLADARGQLTALDVAAERLAGPDAGRCERCGGAIAHERLLARPASTRCVGCAGR